MSSLHYIYDLGPITDAERAITKAAGKKEKRAKYRQKSKLEEMRNELSSLKTRVHEITYGNMFLEYLKPHEYAARTACYNSNYRREKSELLFCIEAAKKELCRYYFHLRKVRLITPEQHRTFLSSL